MGRIGFTSDVPAFCNCSVCIKKFLIDPRIVLDKNRLNGGLPLRSLKAEKFTFFAGLRKGISTSIIDLSIEDEGW